MFDYPHYGKTFSRGDAAVLLCLVQRLTVGGYNSLLSVLYLGKHSSNADGTGGCVHDEPICWVGIGKNRGSTQGSLECLQGSFHLWSPLERLLLLGEFG
jgi:hypothetical protein